MADNKDATVEADSLLEKIATYVTDFDIQDADVYKTAHYCLLDSLGCAFKALRFPECTKHLGPVVSGTLVPDGARVPGTSFVLDPIKAAFDIGCLIRWLDYNDTWLAAEWGHPSDNLGGILAVADYLSRANVARNHKPFIVRDLLSFMIKAHEIQGVLALENSFNRVGLDHVILVKVASTAVITHMLGGNKRDVITALSQAFVDGQALRTYRHAPNTGSRKSWAAGDATSRAVRLAMMTMKGEMGYPTALTAKEWGFYDVLFEGKQLRLPQEFGCYVMEHILFKIAFPAEFHAQTAVECAIHLHPEVKDRIDAIERIELTTHESAIRIISKTGPLTNPADRDHCLQYMVAIGLLYGSLTAEHYEDAMAADPRIDSLRNKMQVQEDKRYSREYLEPDKRSIANAVQIFFNDGSKTDKVEIHYPLGHKRRREEGIPILIDKFKASCAEVFPGKQRDQLIDICLDSSKLQQLPVNEFVELMTI